MGTTATCPLLSKTRNVYRFTHRPRVTPLRAFEGVDGAGWALLPSAGFAAEGLARDRGGWSSTGRPDPERRSERYAGSKPRPATRTRRVGASSGRKRGPRGARGLENVGRRP